MNKNKMVINGKVTLGSNVPKLQQKYKKKKK